MRWVCSQSGCTSLHSHLESCLQTCGLVCWSSVCSVAWSCLKSSHNEVQCLVTWPMPKEPSLAHNNVEFLSLLSVFVSVAVQAKTLKPRSQQTTVVHLSPRYRSSDTWAFEYLSRWGRREAQHQHTQHITIFMQGDLSEASPPVFCWTSSLGAFLVALCGSRVWLPCSSEFTEELREGFRRFLAC